MQPDSKRIALPSATRIRQLASGIVVGAAALGAEIGHAGTGAFGQPRARPSWLQGDEFVAASRSGAQARCSFTCMGRWRRDTQHSTVSYPLEAHGATAIP